MSETLSRESVCIIKERTLYRSDQCTESSVFAGDHPVCRAAQQAVLQQHGCRVVVTRNTMQSQEVTVLCLYNMRLRWITSSSDNLRLKEKRYGNKLSHLIG